MRLENSKVMCFPVDSNELVVIYQVIWYLVKETNKNSERDHAKMEDVDEDKLRSRRIAW